MESDLSSSPNDGSDALSSDEVQRRAKLRALLDGTELDPSQTSDDVAPVASRDSELRAEVPPHHVER